MNKYNSTKLYSSESSSPIKNWKRIKKDIFSTKDLSDISNSELSVISSASSECIPSNKTNNIQSDQTFNGIKN